MNESINDMVGDIIDQLQSNKTQIERVRAVRDPIKREDLENFIIQKSGELVQDALETVQTIREDIIAAPDDKNVSSFADLVTATSNAIETLNKLVASTKKNETTIKVKEMDIASKRELQEVQGQARAALTREEVFKLLLQNAKTVEGEIVQPALQEKTLQ